MQRAFLISVCRMCRRGLSLRRTPEKRSNFHAIYFTDTLSDTARRHCLAGDAGAKFLEAAFLAGKRVHIKFEYPDKSYITGWGAVTECSLKTPHDDVATISGTIKGDGALSDVQQPAA